MPRVFCWDGLQGESNLHQIVVTILVSPSPPFSLRGIGPFPVLENPPVPPTFLWEVLLFLQDLLYESTVFPHQEIGKR